MVPVLRLRLNVRTSLEELRDARLVPRMRRPVQRGEAVTTHNVRIRTQLEEDHCRGLVFLGHGPMQRRVAHAVRLVDLHLWPAKHVEQGPGVGRVRDGVQAAVALPVDDARVRAVLEEQIDGLHLAVARGPLQGRGDLHSADRVDFCTLLNEILACLGLALDCSQVQWRDVVVVLVRRACATRFDQGSDSFGLAQLGGDEDVELRPSYVLPSFHLECT